MSLKIGNCNPKWHARPVIGHDIFAFSLIVSIFGGPHYLVREIMLGRNGAVKIALLYTILGLLWIALSDRIVFLLYGPEQTPFIHILSSAKGFGFVVLTGLLLYQLIKRYNKHNLLYQKKLQVSNEELNLLNRELNDQKKLLGDVQATAKLGGWEYYPISRKMIRSDEIYYILDFAYPAETDPAQNLSDHIHPEDKEKFSTWQNELLTNGVSIDNSFRVINNNGQVKYLHMLAEPVLKNGIVYKVKGYLQDVTASKKLEEERNEYFLRLENTLNSISDAFFVFDKDWYIRAVNPMFVSISGLAKENVLNKKVLDVWPVGANSVFYLQFKKVLEEKVTLKFEEYSSLLNKWLRMICYPTKDGVAVYFTDITESKEKDIQLQRALERYDLVARATNDMFYDYDMTNNSLTYSREFEGITNPILLNEPDPTKAWFSIVHPDDIAKMIEVNQTCIREKRNTYQSEYRVDFGVNDYRYVCDQAYIQYKDDIPVRMIGSIRDIDHLKRTAEENKRLSSVISKVHNMVMITDTQRRIVWINRAFEEISGFSLSEILGRKPQDVIGASDPDHALVKDITERSARQEIFSKELPFFTRQKELLSVYGDFTPLYNDANEHIGYTTVYSDISILKEKEASLMKQNETLREIAWLESHEMRRPLSSILGLVELIRMGTDEAEKNELFRLLDICAKELDSMVLKISQRIQKGVSN